MLMTLLEAVGIRCHDLMACLMCTHMAASVEGCMRGVKLGTAVSKLQFLHPVQARTCRLQRAGKRGA
jgi:hypothetical protein